MTQGHTSQVHTTVGVLVCTLWLSQRDYACRSRPPDVGGGTSHNLASALPLPPPAPSRPLSRRLLPYTNAKRAMAKMDAINRCYARQRRDWGNFTSRKFAVAIAQMRDCEKMRKVYTNNARNRPNPLPHQLREQRNHLYVRICGRRRATAAKKANCQSKRAPRELQ